MSEYKEYYTCPNCGDIMPLEEAETHEEVCIGADPNVETSKCSCCGRVLIGNEIKVQLHALCGTCDWHICAHPDPQNQYDIEEKKAILAGRLQEHVKTHRGREGSLTSSSIGG